MGNGDKEMSKTDQCESFNEWWEMFELHCISSDEKIKVIEIVESAWNHQQKKIDDLGKEYKYFAGTFNEFFNFMQNYCSEVIYVGNTHQQNAVLVIKDLEEKLQAAEENLTECASNYWKEVEKRKAAEEKLKLKTQNEIDASVNADCLAGCRVKLKAAEGKLKDYDARWKERYLVNNPFEEYYRSLEEENRVLREAVEFYARKENWTRRGSQFRLADYGEDDGHSYRYGYLARQALEKVRKE